MRGLPAGRNALFPCYRGNKVVFTSFHLFIHRCNANAIYIFCRESKGDIEDYISPYYTRHTLLEAYAGDVNHLPHRDDWDVPEQVSRQVVLPPARVRQAGRPRVSRYRSGGERATSRRTRSQPQPDAPTSSRQRARKKCGLCGQIGHTRRTCERRAADS